MYRFVCPGPVRVLLAMALAGVVIDVQAADWTLKPRITLSEIYTDNVTLLADDGEDELITIISPGVNLHAEGGRLRLSLDYALQNLFYLGDSDRNQSNHRLQSNATADLIEDLLHLDARASISQVILDSTQKVALDNIGISGGRGDVRTYSLSPWLNAKGPYVNSELRYSYGEIDYSGNAVSDGRDETINGNFSSGHRFSTMTWGLGFQRQELTRNNVSRRESATAHVSYRIVRHLGFIVRGGYENNDQTITRYSPDGSYWSAGLHWQPSSRFALEATQGENDHQGRLTFRPTLRTSLSLTYLDRAVGLRTGSSWAGSFFHRTRRSNWSVNYIEEVTNNLLQIEKTTDNLVVDENGDPVFDKITHQPIYATLLVPVNEEYFRRNFMGTVTYGIGRSTLMLSGHSEWREYQLSLRTREEIGVNGSWAWRFAPRTTSRLFMEWRQTDFGDTPAKDQLMRGSIELRRSIGIGADGTIQYRYTDNTSQLGMRDYHENRITATFRQTF